MTQLSHNYRFRGAVGVHTLAHTRESVCETRVFKQFFPRLAKMVISTAWPRKWQFINENYENLSVVNDLNILYRQKHAFYPFVRNCNKMSMI